MKLITILALFCLSFASWSSVDESEPQLSEEKPLNLTLSRGQIRAIIDESDRIDLQKVQHISSREFAEITRGQKGEVFITLDHTNPEIIALAAATSLGLVVFKYDEEIMDFVQEHRDIVPQQVEDFGYFVGGRAGTAAIVAGSYFLGVVLKNGKLKKAGLVSIAAGLAVGLVTEAFKVTYGRSRPIKGEGPYAFYGEGKSFFSGHTSSAFTLATVFSEIYGKENPAVPYIAYGIATVVAYSRMRAKGHWASDVLAGAIAGTLITKVVYHFVNKKFEDKDGNQYFSIYPSYDPRTKGINVTVNYVPKSWRK